MGKILWSAALILLIGGCTTVDVSPSQSYRPAGAEDLWRITGSIDSQMGLLTDTRHLHVYINGEEVISGQLSAMATGELTGRYRELPVSSICSSEQKTVNWIDVRCLILVDNERAATLTF